MRRLITVFLILISAFVLCMTISTHKAREPNHGLFNYYFDNANRYYTMEVYRWNVENQ